LLEGLVGMSVLPASFLDRGDWKGFRVKVSRLIEAGRKRDASVAALQDWDLEKVDQLPLKALQSKHHQLDGVGWILALRRWFALKPLRHSRRNGSPAMTVESLNHFFAQIA